MYTLGGIRQSMEGRNENLEEEVVEQKEGLLQRYKMVRA